ncbi:MAG: TetR/AcrR family transcriptional regulator [Nonomuraea sp.]|nr:TetR/AcrR family transcriptional regulator [Nonomuraea sp.]
MANVRADAVRNRRLLLDAAAAEFAEHGTDVSVARIAARAGIGKGTVFRHFATKDQLMAAIFADQMEALAAKGDTLAEGPDSGQALLAFMAAGVELRSFCHALAPGMREDPQIRAASDRLVAVARSLTARARRDGIVRDDVTGEDVVLLINAASQAAAPLGEAAAELSRRYLGVIFDGLRAEGARPLPVPPPGALAPVREA